jgi:hypothetical protein
MIKKGHKSVHGAIAEMRRMGADVVHVSWGATGHPKEWYCSASTSQPPIRSEFSFADSLTEVMMGTLAKVRSWPTPGSEEPTPPETKP